MTECSKLYDLVNPADPGAVFEEIKILVTRFRPGFDFSLFLKAFADVERLFRGDFPGYRASNTKYHDMEHTCSVVLAAVRLIFGAMAEGRSFSPRALNIGLLAPLFHDVGLIQTSDDTKGTGAKHTVGHEERSIQFMRDYFARGPLPPEDVDLCAKCIQCTMLAESPADIDFPDNEMRFMGRVTGTADIVAQMADRLYLEKLLMLYLEFQEARLPGFDTALELLEKTQDFYTNVAQKRLREGLGNIAPLMRPHFKLRWDVDRDLYAESIDQNIQYLDSVLGSCRGELLCSLSKLRRGGIVYEFLKTVDL
ncbi:hypothetical protein [Salidesulfovibrio onnuriiensis]|uniref:hypothetical protein n=1 Tax=Salidesulfovibrio onnuriiensis TaxID=2583823 RepID=UPI0011C9A929|nr:hypothetical protein [Salidesulfovibrio onnuriiensis]